MKRWGKWTLGGLQGKVFRLCIMVVITAICGFAILGIVQLRALQKMANDTGESQAKSIKEHSEDSMMKMTEANMKNVAHMSAEYTDWELLELRREAVNLASQVQDIFEHPEMYGERKIYPPDMKNSGKPALQVLYSEQADPTEEDMVMARKLATLGPIMEQMIIENKYDTQDLIIALPCGLSLDMDILSEQKFYEDGSLRPYDPTVRPWWISAVETGEVVLTHAVHSNLLNVSEMEFGVPVYLDGKLVAVVESSIRLETFHDIVSTISYGETGFSIVVSNDGKLIYSPFNEGELKMDNMLSTDINTSNNKELEEGIKLALNGEIGFTEITVDGKDYCTAYAPMKTANWAMMMFVEKEELQAPTDFLLEQMDETTGETLRQYTKSFRQSSWLTLVVMILLVLNAVLVALMFSGKLTNPINKMTESVRNISRDNFNFEMDDIYRTGDEIELLAETFGELSERTREYIREIMEFTAEKERIGAELDVATRIQAAMLPSDFPLYPEKKEFDIYATMTPAKEVGGDFYDIFLLDDDHLCMVVGDVAGKGVPASLFMVISKTMLKNRAQMGGTPAEILADANNSLCEGNKEKMFVTVWLGILTLSTGELVMSSAGHEYPVIQRADGKYELQKIKNGFVMGGRKGMKYKDTGFTLEKGDGLFMYTDGLPEATNSDGVRLEPEGMLAALNRHKTGDTRELLSGMSDEVKGFVGEAPQFDDLTMLIMRYNGKCDDKGTNNTI